MLSLGEIEDSEPEPSKAVLSLSIEETNKLRAKLGMAPLKVNGAENSKPKDENEEIERQRKEELAAKEGGTLIAESKHSLEVKRKSALFHYFELFYYRITGPPPAEEHAREDAGGAAARAHRPAQAEARARG